MAGTGSKWPRSRRLRRRPEFVRAYAEGRRRSSSHFTVFAIPEPAAEPGAGAGARYGITISRKLGGAVVRNRIRRRTRELLRRCGDVCPRGWQIVVNPRTSMLAAALPALEAEMRALLSRLECASPGGGT